jgi:hypothetical protein
LYLIEIREVVSLSEDRDLIEIRDEVVLSKTEIHFYLIEIREVVYLSKDRDSLCLIEI